MAPVPADTEVALRDSTLNLLYSSISRGPARVPLSESVVVSNDRIWKGSFSAPSIDLIAMVVSDCGLASADPEWWNGSVMGCILIGMQPRGGWQIMQRTVQWGQDGLANIMGVNCSKPALYAYFACSIRNRIEVWDSKAWQSPTEGSKEGDLWKPVGGSDLKRPTKLIDGSRGGQGFICSLLRPKEGGIFTIAEQARMQLLSVILVAAGLMDQQNLTSARLKQVMQDDFGLSDRLGVIFHPLLVGLIFGQLCALVFVAIVVYAIFVRNLFGSSAPYIIQLCSLLSWGVGGMSLLMLGGNPRVKIVEKAIPAHVEARLKAEAIETRIDEPKVDVPKVDEPKVDEPKATETKIAKSEVADTKTTKIPVRSTIPLEFGSIHGSVYIPSRGHCTLPVDIVNTICRWDLELQRPLRWKLGFAWSSMFLLISILLQIAGAQVATVGSETMAVVLLMVTALARGMGVSGPEAWLIPRRKMRRGASYGASLLGRMVSRK